MSARFEVSKDIAIDEVCDSLSSTRQKLIIEEHKYMLFDRDFIELLESIGYEEEDFLTP